jgi:surface protein
MFFGAPAFNQDIGSWDVSNVEYMQGMFAGASSFNQDIGSWDVENVEFFAAMFKHATSFDNEGILQWYTPMHELAALTLSSPVDFGQSMANMFFGADAWLAKYRRAGPLIAGDVPDSTEPATYEEVDPCPPGGDCFHPDDVLRYVQYDEFDHSTFGPPSSWVHINHDVFNGTDGAGGGDGSDFPEWGIALAGLALAISTTTSIFFLIRALCCSARKQQQSPAFAQVGPNQTKPNRIDSNRVSRRIRFASASTFDVRAFIEKSLAFVCFFVLQFKTHTHTHTHTHPHTNWIPTKPSHAHAHAHLRRRGRHRFFA